MGRSETVNALRGPEPPDLGAGVGSPRAAAPRMSNRPHRSDCDTSAHRLPRLVATNSRLSGTDATDFGDPVPAAAGTPRPQSRALSTPADEHVWRPTRRRQAAFAGPRSPSYTPYAPRPPAIRGDRKVNVTPDAWDMGSKGSAEYRARQRERERRRRRQVDRAAGQEGTRAVRHSREERSGYGRATGRGDRVRLVRWTHHPPVPRPDPEVVFGHLPTSSVGAGPCGRLGPRRHSGRRADRRHPSSASRCADAPTRGLDRSPPRAEPPTRPRSRLRPRPARPRRRTRRGACRLPASRSTSLIAPSATTAWGDKAG